MRGTTALALAVLFAGCGDGEGGGGSVPPRGAVDRAARASVKVAACTLDSPTRFAATSLPLLSEADVDCVLGAVDCAGVNACFGVEIGACPAADTCLDATTLQTCIGGVGYTIDCGA